VKKASDFRLRSALFWWSIGQCFLSAECWFGKHQFGYVFSGTDNSKNWSRVCEHCRFKQDMIEVFGEDGAWRPDDPAVRRVLHLVLCVGGWLATFFGVLWLMRLARG
jgi:hypothetical protein